MTATPILVPKLQMLIPQRQKLVLPQVWATASAASAAEAASATEAIDVQQRKGPHCLRLVQAAAAVTQEVRWETPRAERTPDQGIAFYRKYTEGMLRRYMKMSMERGRVPSLLGRELFRGNVSSCKVTAFDDVVIFVHDIETCLANLNPALRHLVRRIALEEYTHEEAAAMLGIGLRTIRRRYAEAIDLLTRMLIDRKLLQPMMAGLEAHN